MYKWGKTLAAACLAASLGSFASADAVSAAAAATAKPVTVLFDNVPMTFDDTAAEITKNRTFVPFRAIGEALAIDIRWDAKLKKITATGDVGGTSRTVVLFVGKTNATVDGKAVKFDAAPYMKNGRTLIPLNFFSTQFGAKVGWEPASRTVTIVSPARPMHLRGFYALGAFSERAHIDEMNSVAFGWMRIDTQGNLTTSGQEYYWPQPAGDITPESIVADAAAKGADPYLMVYSVDGNLELTGLLSDNTKRGNAVDNIASLAKDKGFRGVLLDFEGLGLKIDAQSQQQLLNDFVRLLAGRLSQDGIKLSLAVPPPNSNYKGYDYKTLADLADDLVVMTYQYHPKGTAEHTPQPNAKVDAAISSLIKSGISKDKLLLGIDLWSETPQSVDEKLGIAKKYDLKGASFWRMGLYFFYGQSMVDAINQSVLKE